MELLVEVKLKRPIISLINNTNGRVAELVVATDLKSVVLGRTGSSPVSATIVVIKIRYRLMITPSVRFRLSAPINPQPSGVRVRVPFRAPKELFPLSSRIDPRIGNNDCPWSSMVNLASGFNNCCRKAERV